MGGRAWASDVDVKAGRGCGAEVGGVPRWDEIGRANFRYGPYCKLQAISLSFGRGVGGGQFKDWG